MQIFQVLFFVIAIESSALAEKLLNDLLKTTEGFQRLKKMNEELKVAQGNSDSRYVSGAHLTKIKI